MEKTDEQCVDADAKVIICAVGHRIGNHDALASLIDGGQPDNAPDCPWFRQLGMMKVLPVAFEHDQSPYRVYIQTEGEVQGNLRLRHMR